MADNVFGDDPTLRSVADDDHDAQKARPGVFESKRAHRDTPPFPCNSRQGGVEG